MFVSNSEWTEELFEYYYFYIVRYNTEWTDEYSVETMLSVIKPSLVSKISWSTGHSHRLFFLLQFKNHDSHKLEIKNRSDELYLKHQQDQI
jgi:hypothetical protein